MTDQLSDQGRQPLMSRRAINFTMTGIVLSLFVGIMSGTIIANALPVIIRELHGSQSQYTWIVAITLLVSTAVTPVWGKISDVYNKKTLLLAGVGIYVVGSMLCGISGSVTWLLFARGLQGIGHAGLQAMGQIVMAAIVSPRERGKYSGYIGSAFGVGTVAGPLVGGVIVDTPWLGWHWCFFIVVPIAIVSMVLVYRNLTLPAVTAGKVKIDIIGAALLSAAISGFMVWVTIAGRDFPWMSLPSAALVVPSAIALVVFVLYELRVAVPLIPLNLFANRTMLMAIVLSINVGLMTFGLPPFLGQYFQVARGHTATESGLLTLPMIIGLVALSTYSGYRVTRTGRWKLWLVTGMALMTVASVGMIFLTSQTPIWLVGVWIWLLGMALGMTSQNTVLAVQNSVPTADLGAATALVGFFRSFGGGAGVAILGVMLNNRLGAVLADGLATLPGAHPTADALLGSLGDVGTMPAGMRAVVRDSYGLATGHIFWLMAAMAVISLICVLNMREQLLRTTIDETTDGDPINEGDSGTGSARRERGGVV
ncbi:MFS transporter [Antricoccus suffuscus]|uniref:MFS transporter n=1 Tax=Antricoccus suffuscus TaxID=1629062 RepID=A0A2T1A250_9ACTN|nr:MDR family MFS transporter [Antricoccus suffuscus]PRZ42408.1 MFS transporter [Antricoccus suffuscus]